MSRTPKSPEATTTEAKSIGSPPVTFSLEAVEKIVKEALDKQAAAFRLAMADMGQAKPATDISAKNDLACIRVFKKAGFKDIQPRINVLTFNKWVEQGRRPIEGSKSVKVANLRLFHITQTRPLEKADQAKMKEQKAAHEARKNSKVVPINAGAPQ